MEPDRRSGRHVKLSAEVHMTLHGRPVAPYVVVVVVVSLQLLSLCLIWRQSHVYATCVQLTEHALSLLAALVVAAEASYFPPDLTTIIFTSANAVKLLSQL